MRGVAVSVLAFVVAALVFALAAIAGAVGEVGYRELVAAGLALFALAHVLPR